MFVDNFYINIIYSIYLYMEFCVKYFGTETGKKKTHAAQGILS